MEKVIIIGGGVAGLSCLNALLDEGIPALLLEASSIGTPKMCGEFIAPLAVKQLTQWQIGPIQPIERAKFHAQRQHFEITFPQAAGAIARQEVEQQLAHRARQLGGVIKENSPIQHIVPATQNSPYEFHINNGEKIQATTAIFATGRFGLGEKVRQEKYYGIKFHLPKMSVAETLLMYSMPGAYLGLVPIADSMSNCACLAKREVVEQFASCKDFFNFLLMQNPQLSRYLSSLDFNELDWLEGKAPAFCLKKTPNWPRSFWIGDAQASLHPAIGSGFTHGIQTALTAAHCYSKNNPQVYRSLSLKRVKPKLQLGKIFHQFLLNPFFGAKLIPFIKLNAWIWKLFLKKLDYLKE